MVETSLEPRIARTREVVFDAAIAIVAERGFAGATIDAIAQRAGVARSTIYRNWESRTELLLEAVGQEVESGHAPPSGELRSDLIAVVTHLGELLASNRLGSVLASLILESRRDPGLDELRQRFVARRRDALEIVIGAAIERGELPSGTDTTSLGNDLVAPVFLHTLILHGRLDGDWIRQHVDFWLERYGADR